jgi:hypothetical protein
MMGNFVICTPYQMFNFCGVFNSAFSIETVYHQMNDELERI